MSRYIDADAIRNEFGITGYYNGCKECGGECVLKEYTKNEICLAIDYMPTADVVSREQFNACYDELLKLRSGNERLTVRLLKYEDDAK